MNDVSKKGSTTNIVERAVQVAKVQVANLFFRLATFRTPFSDKGWQP
jgi:hypothetical protein